MGCEIIPTDESLARLCSFQWEKQLFCLSEFPKTPLSQERAWNVLFPQGNTIPRSWRRENPGGGAPGQLRGPGILCAPSGASRGGKDSANKVGGKLGYFPEFLPVGEFWDCSRHVGPEKVWVSSSRSFPGGKRIQTRLPEGARDDFRPFPSIP